MKRNIIIISLLCIALFGCKAKQETDLQNIANLTSSEYKLLLNPSKFDDYNVGFKNYWSIIKEVATEQNIPILENDDPLVPGLRYIGFFDTKNMDLRQNGYALRRRIAFINGEQKPGSEFTLKFRNVDPQIAMKADVKIGEGYTPEEEQIELESDIVYFSISNNKTETIFSIQNSIELDENPKMTIGELAKIYPVLATFGIPLEDELRLVADNEPVEYKVKLGKLDFGDELYGKMSISVWVAELGLEQISIPEFSFDHPFHQDKKYNSEAMETCASFINKLNEKYPDWTAPGKSKSAHLFDYENKKMKEIK